MVIVQRGLYWLTLGYSLYNLLRKVWVKEVLDINFLTFLL